MSQYSKQWSKPEASPPKLPLRNWATKDTVWMERKCFFNWRQRGRLKLFRLHVDQGDVVINTFANYSHYADKNNSAINNREIN